MATVKLDSKPSVYRKIGPMTEPTLLLEAEQIKFKASGLLARHRITGTTTLDVNKVAKGTRGNKYSADYDVIMDNVDSGGMAIEFGHMPSGIFAGTKTRAPMGLYILTRASGLMGKDKA